MSIQTDSKALDYRVYVHDTFSLIDFDLWVLEQLEVKNFDNVLDIGCGRGKHLFTIASLTKGAVIGTDLSDESLKKCIEEIKEKRLSNTAVIKSDHTTLREALKEKKFDKILSSFAIYYTSNPEKTFTEIHSLLKKGGTLFICGPTSENNREFIELIRKAGIPFSLEFHEWSNFLQKKAKPLMKKLFGNVEEVVLENPVIFPNQEVLFNYWKATPHYFYEIEEVMLELIKEEFRKNERFITNKVVIGLKSVKK